MAMVNDAVSAERELALSYAPGPARPAVEALFALDARLRHLTLVARDPTIGLMRLTWWSDALARLDAAPPPAEPLLQALAASVLPFGLTGAGLAFMADGWMRLLHTDALDQTAYAQERGGTLFQAAAQVLGGSDERVPTVGQGWALADLTRDRPAEAPTASAAARALLEGCYTKPWPRALRPLGALGLSARADLIGRWPPGSPRRVARLLAHRLTGR